MFSPEALARAVEVDLTHCSLQNCRPERATDELHRCETDTKDVCCNPAR
ncbi:hypothetical protein [Xylophilus sp. GOD-11R]|nr:hypothetical protein [Xylophilus sp. GOD-11R]WPB55977.1 hypothetical protein R9X41_17760 [Xylophilus sp. GOD-11R]